jgi:TonB family protein
MKKSVIFLAGMVITMIAAGQNPKIEDVIFTAPKFNGAETFVQGSYFTTVDDFLSHTVEYPQEALTGGFQGTEVVEFVVTTSGEVTHISVINSVCPEIDEEVIRMLQSTRGLWQPGSVNGEAVAMEQEVAVSFKLHPTGDFVAMAKDYLKQGNKMLLKGNTRKALDYYDKAVTLLPNEEAPLAARGMCRYRLGDEEGATRDWNRLKSLGYFDNFHSEDENLLANYKVLKGYNEMIRFTQNQSK